MLRYYITLLVRTKSSLKLNREQRSSITVQTRWKKTIINKWHSPSFVFRSQIPHHTAQCLSLWEGDMARIADWGQNGWPMLLQSVISMFDQPDYRDLTDRRASRWMGREWRPREASTLVMKRLLSEVKAASEKQQTNAHCRDGEKVSGGSGGDGGGRGETDWEDRLKNRSIAGSALRNTQHQNIQANNI